jgi:tetratricopeptide (TPR) repeat protein
VGCADCAAIDRLGGIDMSQGFQYQDELTPSAIAPAPGESPAERAIRKSKAGDVLYSNRHFIEARELYAHALRLQPGNARLLWLMGMCNWQLGEMDLAGNYLQASVRVDPQFSTAHAILGRWYLLHGKMDAAMDSTAKAMALTPQDDACIAARAWVLESAGDLDGAWVLIKQLVAKGYDPTIIAPLYARMAQSRGEAQDAFTFVNAILSKGGLSRNTNSELYLAAAGLLDSMGQYDQAFLHATLGNTLKRPAYDPKATSDAFDRITRYFTRARISTFPRSSLKNEKPVFIVGMPRSGTSLVEQILASHPQVHGAGEVNFMQNAFLATLGTTSATENDFPQCLDRLPADDLDRLAEVYLKPLTALNPSAARITDKMPLNFMHLGLISILLPHARIIHCRRDPLDTCLSCYMTPFNFGNDFKYDLTHLGLFYRDYHRLMSHWKSVLPTRILDVDYEQLVADPRGQTQAMLEFINLSWDEKCVRFHENKRPVATSSVEQVRKPIYKSSLNRWRRYENHLGPLKAAVGSTQYPE